MGNDVIVASFLKIAQQFFVCEYFLLIPIDVLSFKVIEGQRKELQGVVPNTPGLRMTKKPGQDRVKTNELLKFYSGYHGDLVIHRNKVYC